ncbi:Uncharacterised protein [Enterobacter hormaechei]|nr:Uncharacterised protein [Enterobacter hormaechei]
MMKGLKMIKGTHVLVLALSHSQQRILTVTGGYYPAGFFTVFVNCQC